MASPRMRHAGRVTLIVLAAVADVLSAVFSSRSKSGGSAGSADD
ncbi:hypothetical protein ABZY19_14075 [Streptomyces sp. NPDC006475]|uniref:Uncharacterized protein n=1 Tax=Streptomyces achmelvichensis TaxID=3134111 RepID=A0ACC6PPM5_9ACTN|nr:hypothetical protein OG317_04640 [Streptomyces sp. NBC_01167]